MDEWAYVESLLEQDAREAREAEEERQRRKKRATELLSALGYGGISLIKEIF